MTRRLPLLAVALCSLVLLAGPGPALAQDQPGSPLALEVSVGLGERIPWAGWFPVRVTLRTTEAVRGRVTVRDGRDHLLVAEPVDLAAGDGRQLAWVLSSRFFGGVPVTVRVEGVDGSTLAERVVEPVSTSTGTHLVLDRRGPPFSGERPLPGQPQGVPFFRPGPDELPEVAQAWDGVVSVLVGSSFPLDAIPEGTRRALRDWIRRGGVLVLTGGTGGERIVEALGRPWFPASRTVDLPVEDLAPLGTRYRSDPPAVGDESVPVHRVEVPETPDARVVCRASDGTPLVVVRRAGHGAVVHVAVDPWSRPFQEWPGLRLLLGDALSRGGVALPAGPFLSEILGEGSSGQGRLLALAVFFVLLAFAVGPVPYWIPGNRYRMWWRAPAAILLLGLLSLGLARWVRAAPSAIDGAVLEDRFVDALDGPRSELILIGSAGRSAHEVELPGTPVGICDVRPYPRGEVLVQRALPGTPGGPTLLGDLPVSPWGTRGLAVRRLPPADGPSVRGRIVRDPSGSTLECRGLPDVRSAVLIVPVRRGETAEMVARVCRPTADGLELAGGTSEVALAAIDETPDLDDALLARLSQMPELIRSDELWSRGQGIVLARLENGPPLASGPRIQARPGLRFVRVHLPLRHVDASGRPRLPAGFAQRIVAGPPRPGPDGRLVRTVDVRPEATWPEGEDLRLDLDVQPLFGTTEVEVRRPETGTWEELGRASEAPFTVPAAWTGPDEGSLAVRLRYPADARSEPDTPVTIRVSAGPPLSEDR